MPTTGADGGVPASVPSNGAARPDGIGYWMVASDGGRPGWSSELNVPGSTTAGAGLSRSWPSQFGSGAPCRAAEKAREEVAAMILAGQSDRQILDSFIARYGERILAEPEGVKSVVLTTVPIVMLICGGLFLGWFLSRNRARVGTA